MQYKTAREAYLEDKIARLENELNYYKKGSTTPGSWQKVLFPGDIVLG